MFPNLKDIIKSSPHLELSAASEVLASVNFETSHEKQMGFDVDRVYDSSY